MRHLSGFVAYLTAKRSVDDRALNRYVLETVRQQVPAGDAAHPLRVLDVGAGNASFLERLLDWDLLRVGDYVGIDADPEAIADGRRKLSTLALTGNGRQISARLDEGDVFGIDLPASGFDLLIAHALLDLVDVPAVLPRFWRWLRPGGCFWFTINFDGETIFRPEIDRDFEATLLVLYHHSMDARARDASHCGRNLFGHIEAAGGQVLAAGASDWIVHPVGGSYPADEATFLHHIIDTIDNELRRNPSLDANRFAEWVATRHRQIDDAKLIYIAKQLDLFGRAPAE